MLVIEGLGLGTEIGVWFTDFWLDYNDSIADTNITIAWISHD